MRRDPGYIDTFNSIAQVYDKKYGKSCIDAHNLILEYAEKLNLSPKAILDIGCGTGEFLRTVIPFWPSSKLFGVDPAKEMIAIAKRKVPNAKTYIGKAEHLPLGDNTIDFIVSTTSFSHWKNQVKALREIYRVLAPGGNCFIVEHAYPNFIIRIFLFIINRLANLQKIGAIKAMIKKTRLTLLEIQEKRSFYFIHLQKNV